MATWDRNEGAAALKRGAEITQCIHLAYPGAMYTLQFSYKMIEAGIFACQAIFSNDANCTSRIDGDLDGTIVYSGGDGWQTSKILGPAPGGAKSVNMYCVNGNSSDTAILYFDKITLTPSSCN